MAVRIQFRRDTSANWTSNNPILAQGEMGLELDTQKYKMGDGTTPWTSLGYTSSEQAAIDAAAAAEASEIAAAASAALALQSEVAAEDFAGQAEDSADAAAASEAGVDADRVAAQAAAAAALVSENAAELAETNAETAEANAALSAAAAAADAAEAAGYVGYVQGGSPLPVQAGRKAEAEALLASAVWWIDAKHGSASGQTISNLGWGGSALNAQAGSSGSADSNDPKHLDWTGENYVYLPGVASNYMSVPDEAALDITGDIDIRVRVALDDWTPASATSLASKMNSSLATQRSWRLRVDTGGTLTLIWSVDGTNVGNPSATSTTATGITDSATKWVRAVLDVDDGGVYKVYFYLSDDGVAWTQLGSTVTGGATTSIYAGTETLYVGSAQGSEHAAGKFYRAQIRNGIDGPTVLDVDCSQITSGSATSFTALTGQTVTINRSTSGRKSVAVTQPCWLFGTDDYLEVADNDLLDFGASDSFTVLAVVRQPSFSLAQTILSKRPDSTTNTVGYALRNSGSTASDAIFVFSDGSATINPTIGQTAGRVGVLAGVRDKSLGTATAYVPAGPSVSATDTTSGSLANTTALRVGRLGASATSYADMEGIAFAVFRKALTPAEIGLLNWYYQMRDMNPIYAPQRFPNAGSLPANPANGQLVYQQDTNELLVRQDSKWNGVVTEGSVLRSIPAAPSPAESLLKQAVWWIDANHSTAAGQRVSNLGWGGSVLDATLGSSGGADSNDPRFLDFTGEPYVWLPDTTSGNVMTIDHSAGRYVGDTLDLRSDIAPDAWQGNFIGKAISTVAANLSYYFGTASTNGLVLNVSDGTTIVGSTQSSLLPEWVTGQRVRVRALYVRDTGAGQYAVSFWRTTDFTTPLTNVTSWTQIGTTTTGASIGAILDVNTALSFGAYRTGGSATTTVGRHFAHSVYVNGTAQAVVDTSVLTSGSQTSFTALTGQTVSINRSSSGTKSVAVVAPVWLFGTDDFMEVPDNDLLDFGASDSFTVLAVVRRWPNNVAGGIIQKANNTSSTMSGWSVYDGASGVYSFRYGNGTTRSIVNSAAFTMGASQLAGVVRDASTTTMTVLPGGTPTSDGGAANLVATSEVLRVGRNGAEYSNMEFVAAAIWRRALTADEINTLTDYMRGRVA